MKRKRWTPLALALVVLLGAAGALSATPPALELNWWTVDGGGGALGGGAYSLSGTAGQPDAGPTLGGAAYTLDGGFWYGAAAPAGHAVYLPLVVRDH